MISTFHSHIDSFFLKVPLMNSTMMKFLSKITILKSLNCDDQLIVTQENIYVVLQFCIFKFATSLKGNDQLSWLLFNNIPERGEFFLNLVLSFQEF